MQFDEAFERLLKTNFYKERAFLGDMKTVLEQSALFTRELEGKNITEAMV